MAWKNIKEENPPLNHRVLARWDDGHIEDVTFDIFCGSLVHWLYDGEVLNYEPTQWLEIPE